MSKYYHLKVKEVKQETADAVTISFWHPLSEQVKYKVGQFLTVIVQIDGKKYRRAYSMSSSPFADTAIAITVKRVVGGLVSNWLNDNVQAGDFIEVMEPMGNFSPILDRSQSRNVVLIGAGSGVTPLMSIAKSVLFVEANSTVTLLYGNRNEESILFKQELNDLENKYGKRLQVIHCLSQPSPAWQGEKGRLNAHKIESFLKNSPIGGGGAVFICGPEGMMQEVQTTLADLGVPKNQVFHESFAASTNTHGEVIADENPGDGSLKTQEITVLYEGSEYKFAVEPHQTILEAALELDIDLPYSCQAGMCTACLGKCTSGKIKLDEEDGLTQKELDQGYILTCVAHPLTADVVIEL